MSEPVLLGAAGIAEIELLHALESQPGLTIARRCSDGPELLAAATAGIGRLAIISADFCPLDLDFLTSITVADCAIILLVTSPDHAPLARVATELGIRVAGDVVEVLQSAQQWREELATKPQILDGASHPSGRVIAVWGPAGAPGRTRLAIELATHLSRVGQRTLLIDSDPYGGVMAPALGLLDEASGLIAATRAAGRGELTPEGLLRHAVSLGPDLRLLVGIPRADRWPELTSAALERVWAIAREGAQWAVIDAGFCLETDEELTFDTHAPQRNGATLSALEAADIVIAVGQADPVQMPRFVRGLSELREAVSPKTLVAVANRVRTSVAGPSARESVNEILARYAGIERVHIIPEDGAVFDSALLEGTTALDIAPNSPATLAIAELANELIASSQRAGSRENTKVRQT